MECWTPCSPQATSNCVQAVLGETSCPSWSTPAPSSDSKYTSSISFTLPSDPSLTFFLTRGAPVQGTFTIDRERTPGKEFKVDVTAEYDDEEKAFDVLKNTKACFAGQTNGGHEEQGILLWVRAILMFYSTYYT